MNDTYFSPLNYLNLSPPKFYKHALVLSFMKIEKTKSREYNKKEYFKYRIIIPNKIIREAGLKEGDELDAEIVKKGEIKLKRK